MGDDVDDLACFKLLALKKAKVESAEESELLVERVEMDLLDAFVGASFSLPFPLSFAFCSLSFLARRWPTVSRSGSVHTTSNMVTRKTHQRLVVDLDKVWTVVMVMVFGFGYGERETSSQNKQDATPRELERVDCESRIPLAQNKE